MKKNFLSAAILAVSLMSFITIDGINIGDSLVLEEYTTADPNTRVATGRKLEKKVTYLRKFN